jgi:hypothetical protein
MIHFRMPLSLNAPLLRYFDYSTSVHMLRARSGRTRKLSSSAWFGHDIDGVPFQGFDFPRIAATLLPIALEPKPGSGSRFCDSRALAPEIIQQHNGGE